MNGLSSLEKAYQAEVIKKQNNEFKEKIFKKHSEIDRRRYQIKSEVE